MKYAEKTNLYNTLVEVLEVHREIENKGITFIESRNKESFISYKELYDKALKILKILHDYGIQPKNEVIFQVDDNEKSILLFWACLLGGIIPVPVSVGRNEELRLKIFKIWKYLNDPYLIIQKEHLERVEKSFPDKINELKGNIIDVESILNELQQSNLESSVSNIKPYKASPNDIAFIQFSSGSTGDPKGVVLTHRNLLTNIYDMLVRTKATNDDKTLSWMPLTHDMGIIGFHLSPLVKCIQQYLIPTSLFIRRPMLWMDKTSEHKVTITCSPNFGYRYFLKCLRREKGSWDLSNVRLIFNGAEPISADLYIKFFDTMSQYGLKKSAMFPCYGLAEASLCVSTAEPGEKLRSINLDRQHLDVGECIREEEDQRESVNFVDIGYPLSSISLRITDSNRQVLDENFVGYVEIKGNNVTNGYYNNNEASKEIITKDGWLNTQDLGFLRNGRLFITGRAKDIIFVSGKNYFSHDLERIAEEIEGVELGKISVTGAFNLEKQADEVIAFLVYRKKDLKEFFKYANKIKERISIKAGINLDYVIPVLQLPKTSSGKVQRYKLAESYQKGDYEQIIKEMKILNEEVVGINESKETVSFFVPDKKNVISSIKKHVEKVLGFAVSNLDQSIMEFGLESVKVPELTGLLEKTFNIDLPASLIFDYPTINKIADYIISISKGASSQQTIEAPKIIPKPAGKPSENKIAIIGIGCRFPGGGDAPEKFWENLMNGVDAIKEVPLDRWNIEDYYNPSYEAQGKITTKYGGFLNDIKGFDPEFFSITPVEAKELDPQQRMLLEVSWEALEHANMNIHVLEGSNTGVFIGISNSDYAYFKAQEDFSTYSLTGSLLSTASGRISYTFGFQGPSLSIDTACSSSLVAIYQAGVSLSSGECDLALAGGVNLLLAPRGYIGLSRLNVLAPDGRCKTFDDSADGYGRGEGCGLIVLKRLEDALKDRDRIIAVIAGGAVNHDGRSSGLTVPNGLAQEAVIRSALQVSGLKPDDIDYIETHGTGTKLGDPQEVNVLNNVFGNRPKDQSLLIGSVKTNIGHLESAAGVAGIIKVALSLQNKKIPKQLHFNTPNQLIPWHDIPKQVTWDNIKWNSSPKPRVAGISSFGLSGTNAHIILQESPDSPVKVSRQIPPKLSSHLLCFSAKSHNTLQKLANIYRNFLSQTEEDLADICYTANTTRSFFPHRLALVGSSKEDMVNKLSSWLANPQRPVCRTSPNPPFPNHQIAFLFTGQGAQYTGMGQELYNILPAFKAIINQCDSLFRNYLHIPLLDILFGNNNEITHLIHQTDYSQPILFSIEYALSQVLRGWGILPCAVLGHSIGEFAAACVAGILKLEDAVHLVAARSRLMHKAPGTGAMGVAFTDKETVMGIIASYKEKVSIAALNSPCNTVISGETEAVSTILDSLKNQGIKTQVLNVSHGFHSPVMESILPEFEQIANQIKYGIPAIPYISGMKGNEISGEGIDAQYWTQQIRQSVRFSDAIKKLEQNDFFIFLEIGPAPILSSLGQQNISNEQCIFLPTLRKGKGDWEQILSCVGNLYIAGVPIELERLHNPECLKKVYLPKYPFEKQEYWISSNNNVYPPKPQEPQFIEINNDMPAGHQVVEQQQNKIGPSNEGQKIEAIQAELKEMIYIISGIESSEISENTGLFSLGLDSLMLIQFRKKIQKKYGLDIPAERFLVELTTVKRIAEFILKNIPESEKSDLEQGKDKMLSDKSPLLKDDLSSSISLEGQSELERIIGKQLEFMEKQLEIFRFTQQRTKQLPQQKMESSQGTDHVKPPSHERAPMNIRSMKFDEDSLNPTRKAFLERFIKRYNTKTAKSKKYAEKDRRVFSDWINSLNFRKSLKDLIYPIVSDHSEGSRFWDIDGNEYIDLAIGYGVNFFGHRPPFIQKAIEQQLYKGIELGPQSQLAGEVAHLITELTGTERVSFANTGSEAVMEALRLARAVTKRSKIIRFSGSYHGISDIVLAEADEHGTFPLTSGITQGSVEDTIILGYGSQESLDTIKTLGDQLSAVLVEPVQSRRPGFQPKGFLQNLRSITEEIGAALIFDEMITGFRIHPGGVQAHFGIQADIVTYGKIVAGGMPIGIVAGKKRYLDAVDGGEWYYEDHSVPDKNTTFIAGTFCKHPLAMAAARAVLQKMKEGGPALQEEVNQKTEYLANTLNKYFKDEDVPIRIRYFASQFRFESFGIYDLALLPIEMELLFYLLMEKGVYTWERRICFLSTAHSYEDIDYIIQAIKDSICELRKGGFSFAGSDEISSDKKADQNVYYPMSSVQKRLFTLSLLEGGETAYHLPSAIRIDGALEIQKIEAIFKNLINRHETLRTSFMIDDDKFLQKVNEEVEFTLHYKKSKEDDVSTLLKDIIQPFDLSKPPLMHICLVEIGKDSYLLIMDFHHIIVDGYSLGILLQEFMALYLGAPLPSLESKYKDYVEWEQSYLVSNDAKEDEQYWLQKFSGSIPQLDLPIDYSRPPVVTFEGGTVEFTIEKDTTTLLKKLAVYSDTSLFMVLLSFYLVLLNKLSTQKDIVVGIPTTAREHGNFEQNVGMYLNTVALRFKLSGHTHFLSFLHDVKKTCLEGFSHQDYPFDRLVEKLGRVGEKGRNPLFDTTFGYENADNRILNLEGLTITPCSFDNNTSMFDITFDVIEEKDCLNIDIIYNSNLFKKKTMECWNEYFKNIINHVLNNREILISDILIISESEKKTIFQEFNATKTDYPIQESFVQLFERQAKSNPRSIAVVVEDYNKNASKENNIKKKKKGQVFAISSGATYTYSRLNREANQLAHLLTKNGIKQDQFVGILMDRSFAMMKSILAVWKAGGAYIPLDPTYPIKRKAEIINDSQAKVLLTTSSYFNAEEDSHLIPACKIICLDEERDEISNQPSSNPENDIDISSIAYVIYTSGSTGKPKGVIIEHQGMINHIYAKINALQITDHSIIAQNSSHCFDISVWQFFSALAAGGTTVIYTNELVFEPSQFIETVKTNCVTILEVVPSYLSVMLDYIEANPLQFANLKYLLVTGEEIKVNLVKRWFANFPQIKMVNAYGPTEASDDITHHIMDRAPDTEWIPIGKTIQNLTIYIVDPSMNLCPIGVKGEICVAGIGVGRGYLNNEEKTREIIMEDPFSNEKGVRLYKTGDLGCWNSDGSIRFFGRKDHQVKIRGFRIELGEIENRLLGYEGIKEAVVIVKELGLENKFLCAFYTCKEDKTVDLAKLKHHLSQTLPHYMIPDYFVELQSLPLTPNGKIDRKALPEPEISSGREKTYSPPTNKIEETLVEIWQNLLGVNQIDIYDDFFDLGGHSLKAIRVISQIAKELNVEVPLTEFLKNPTIKELSTYIMNAVPRTSDPIKPCEPREYYPVSATERGIYAISQLDKMGVNYNIGGALIVKGDIKKERVEKVMNELINRHESLRTSFHILNNGELVQRVHSDCKLQLTFDQLRQGETIEDKMQQFVQPFDLSMPPLIRIRWIEKETNDTTSENTDYKVHNTEPILLFDMHHIISDAFSIDNLLREFSDLYTKKELTPLCIQYKDFVIWQQDYLLSEQGQRHGEYWKQQFSGTIPELNMPTDFPRPSMQSFQGETVTFEIDNVITKKLHEIASHHRATLYMVLLAAYQILLSKYTGQEDIALGTPVAGRTHPDTQDLIGLFINVLVIRNLTASDKNFERYLEEVKDNVLEAFEHQDYPFETLVENLNIERKTNRNPLFDAMFLLQNAIGEEEIIRSGNLQLSPYHIDNKTSNYDLILEVTEVHNILRLRLQYSIALFKHSTAIEILKNYINILNQVIENTHILLKDINIETRSLMTAGSILLEEDRGDFDF